MGRRKGELSRAQINREWPHQVALRDDAVRARFEQVMKVSKLLECAPRNHNVVHLSEGTWFSVYCFATAERAAEFKAAFGGVDFDPADMGKGARWHQWMPGSAGKSVRRA